MISASGDLGNEWTTGGVCCDVGKVGATGENGCVFRGRRFGGLESCGVKSFVDGFER